MFEREDDLVGSIESKGTEVIRRDTVPITGKLLKKTLDIFFRTRDLSKVKAYLHERWLKVRSSSVKVQHVSLTHFAALRWNKEKI